MKKALNVVVGVGMILGIAVPLRAQTKAVTSVQTGLLLAYCPGPVPCNTSGITFDRGSVRIRKIKQPDPVFSSYIGTVSLQGIIPPRANLSAAMSARVSYGTDPNGNCPLANTQAVLNPWATSSLTCTESSYSFFSFYTGCRGDLNLVALVPPECSDVDLIVEDIRTEVFEAGMVGVTASLIARDGHQSGSESPTGF